MKKTPPLSSSFLRARLDPARIPYADSAAIPKNVHLRPPQPRAMQALELGMHIKDSGYNIYLSGEANLGRTFMLLDFLQPKAKKAPTPPDLIYVHNFEDPDSPCLIELPAGQGRKLKNAMADMLARIRKDILARFENDAYTRRRSGLLDSFQGRKDKLFRQMDAVAGTRGFHLDMDDQGAMTLYPLIEGKRLSEQEFESLNSEQRKDLRSKGDSLLHAMTGLIRKLSRMEQDFLDKERLLEEEVASEVLDRLLTPLAEKFCKSCKSEALEKHFKNVREHILDNLDSIISREAHQPGLPPLPGGQPPYPPLASPHGPEAPGPAPPLFRGGGQQLQVEQGGGQVVEGEAEGGGAVLVGGEAGLYLGLPPEGVVHLHQVLVAALPHGEGQAVLTDLAVAPAPVGDGIPAVLQGQLAGGRHVVHSLGEGEVVHAGVAQGQLQQLMEGDRPGSLGHDIEDQQL